MTRCRQPIKVSIKPWSAVGSLQFSSHGLGVVIALLFGYFLNTRLNDHPMLD
ncbi:hypothetical protein HU759_011780 [Pseudomonas sp. OE 28.3]|uniref:hypothetical protein n=1 Tax=unclassified Pseudomonas TaxID=196821 RepID=UPI00164732B5|nr:hypothetical protein [Pseudomonas sp. OE 28.3]QXI61394.1 hypothetical protein HU759_011780 [Pseudomonas sp. OE 28.3]